MLIYFLLVLQKFFVLLGSIPGNAGQIMKALIEESGISMVKTILPLAVLI